MGGGLIVILLVIILFKATSNLIDVAVYGLPAEEFMPMGNESHRGAW